MYRQLVAIFVLAAIAPASSAPAGETGPAHEHRGDKYANFAALAAHEREGTDYRIELKEHAGAPVTVLAIHGGHIERGTTELGLALADYAGAAKSPWSFYSFEGIKPEGNRTLHVTSSHFDEPRALALAAHSQACISLHGFAEAKQSIACVGGGANSPLPKAMAHALQAKADALKLIVEYPCERFEGSDPVNILNRCAHQGVQLELSAALRDRLLEEPALTKQIAEVIRAAASAR